MRLVLTCAELTCEIVLYFLLIYSSLGGTIEPMSRLMIRNKTLFGAKLLGREVNWYQQNTPLHEALEKANAYHNTKMLYISIHGPTKTKLQGRMSAEILTMMWKEWCALSKGCESRTSKSSISHCIRGHACCRMVFGWRGRGTFTSPFRGRNKSGPRFPRRCNDRRRMATISRHRWRGRRILVSRTMRKRGRRWVIGARASAFRGFIKDSFVREVVQGNTDF